MCCRASLRLVSVRTAELLGKTVDRVVALALVADEASNGEVGGLAGNHLAVLVDVGNGDLDRGVVLGLNDTAGSRALAGHVKVNKLSLLVSTPPNNNTYVVVLHGGVGGGPFREGRRLQRQSHVTRIVQETLVRMTQHAPPLSPHGPWRWVARTDAGSSLSL